VTIRQHKADRLSGHITPLQEAELAPPPTTYEHSDTESKDKIAGLLFRHGGCQRMLFRTVQQVKALAMSYRFD